eukprot:GGOE01002189.1.p1 GENE.GGOE01002189.1~~GGOE01002189.1.p1  ORF type:complete len:704 (-),score=220.73 GGOE01002189.1:366-2330(-)
MSKPIQMPAVANSPSRMGSLHRAMPYTVAGSPKLDELYATASTPVKSRGPWVPIAFTALVSSVALMVAAFHQRRKKAVAVAAIAGSKWNFPMYSAIQPPISRRTTTTCHAAKEIIFNETGEALKRMQAGVDKLSSCVGVTLGPKGRNVVLESNYGAPKIVNDGVTIAREIDLQDPVEAIGAKLVRQASQKTNDQAGDGTTTAIILSHAFITEGMKIVAAGANPVQLTRGMEKTVAHLVQELKKLSKEVEDNELAYVASVSAGGNIEVGEMISKAMARVGRRGVITMEESRGVDNDMYVVEGMQFERGFMSPYFVTDAERNLVHYDNARLLLVDMKITSARDVVNVLELSLQEGFPLIILAEGIEQEALATLVVNRLRGSLKVCAIKAPGFGERKTQYLEDIAILTGGTVVKAELGLQLSKVGKEVLGTAARVEITKDSTTIVGDGSTAPEVQARIRQIEGLLEAATADYEKDRLRERIARLSGGVAIIQVGANTETELKDKKLRVEDALMATKAAVEEGIVIGGGCTLLALADRVDDIKGKLENDEQKVGAEIIKRALSYPLRLVAHNAGENGFVVLENVRKLGKDMGFNAATGQYEDLMKSGIIDPTKVIRCCLENACSVAKLFLTSEAVVVEIPEKGAGAQKPNPADSSFTL